MNTQRITTINVHGTTTEEVRLYTSDSAACIEFGSVNIWGTGSTLAADLDAIAALAERALELVAEARRTA